MPCTQVSSSQEQPGAGDDLYEFTDFDEMGNWVPYQPGKVYRPECDDAAGNGMEQFYEKEWVNYGCHTCACNAKGNETGFWGHCPIDDLDESELRVIATAWEAAYPHPAWECIHTHQWPQAHQRSRVSQEGASHTSAPRVGTSP